MKFTIGQDFKEMGDGRRLWRGEDGLGTLVTGNGSVVAGQLSIAEGPRPAIAEALDGYGFIFSRNEKVTSFTRRKTYEEVMSTAEFDSCGRVIHTEGGMVTQKRTSVEWICEGAGCWHNGAPVQPDDPHPAVPTENQPRLILNAVYEEYSFGRHHRTALDRDFDIAEAEPDGHLQGGWYELHVWPLPDGRVLCLEHHGAVFILAPGETFVYNPDKNDTYYQAYIYTLKAI